MKINTIMLINSACGRLFDSLSPENKTKALVSGAMLEVSNLFMLNLLINTSNLGSKLGNGHLPPKG